MRMTLTPQLPELPESRQRHAFRFGPHPFQRRSARRASGCRGSRLRRRGIAAGTSAMLSFACAHDARTTHANDATPRAMHPNSLRIDHQYVQSVVDNLDHGLRLCLIHVAAAIASDPDPYDRIHIDADHPIYSLTLLEQRLLLNVPADDDESLILSPLGCAVLRYILPDKGDGFSLQPNE